MRAHDVTIPMDNGNENLFRAISTGSLRSEFCETDVLIRFTEFEDGVGLGTIYLNGKSLVDISIRKDECLLRDATTAQTILSSPVVMKI